MGSEEMRAGKPVEDEIDVLEYSERGEAVPHARNYRVRIDGQIVKIDTPTPKGVLLLSKVSKRPCAFELIAEFQHHHNEVIEPDEVVDLRTHGLKGFITAHKEIVTIFIDDAPKEIERGERTVAEILDKVGKNPDGFILFEEKDGPPMPLPVDRPVMISGCEVFRTQVQGGGSS